MECYRVTKKTETLLFASKWMGPGNVMLGAEARQPHISSPLWELE